MNTEKILKRCRHLLQTANDIKKDRLKEWEDKQKEWENNPLSKDPLSFVSFPKPLKPSLPLSKVTALTAQTANLIHSTTGQKSSYAESLRNIQKTKDIIEQFLSVIGILQAFSSDLENGYLINIRQEVEAIVISEILSQARKLLETKNIHPAASVIVACAGLEEFLRSWCEQKNIIIPEKQRKLSKFINELRSSDEITLAISRRIQSWADYRNDAAHGLKWESITKQIAERTIKEIEDFIIENQQIIG